MDAAEADADVKLYKASGELLSEVQAKIPRLVRVSNNSNKYRLWIIDSKVYEITHLLDSFQEWPQLLDPYLTGLIQVLVDAYLSYCVLHSDEYVRKHNQQWQVSPLPRAISRVLYAFCKVRGRKIIVRLLNNEPKYIEPMISCFRLWTSQNSFKKGHGSSIMTWEERYIHLLWLSHLLLAPFELSTISGLSIDTTREREFSEIYVGLPNVSINLATDSMDHLHMSSKAREAAVAVLVRLSLRGDMQRLGLTEKVVSWAISELQQPTDRSRTNSYWHIGLLELLFGIMNSASDSETAPFLNNVFQIAYTAATVSEKQFESIRDSAPARKLLVKVMRSTVVHAMAVNNSQTSLQSSFDLNIMLEECVQALLEFLADKDTPVRQAASKALSLVCLKLNAGMSSEVVEAVIDGLHENMLLENLRDGKLFPITDIIRNASVKYKKNLNAVDPLKWHGCMLTLGHLLFRRSLPISQLPAVIEALLMGLDFEQRSNVGTSVGVGVRDAACFGIWSLARKYSTAELDQSTITSSLLPNPTPFGGVAQNSTLQLIATRLAISACLDPSGNLRRGSSAALQELIGRHPDAIVEGIPIVQTIDYHAVARRSRALTEVAIGASRLSAHYHGALLYALLAWSGARATDADSRRYAAEAAGLLVSMAPQSDILPFLRELLSQVGYLKVLNSGSNAAARHGLLCTLAATIKSLSEYEDLTVGTEIFEILRPVLEDITSIIGTIEGRVTVEIENILEGISKVILASTGLISNLAKQSDSPCSSSYPSQWAFSVLPILERCTVSSDKNFVADAAAQASIAVLSLLTDESQQYQISFWLDQKQQSKAEFTCKGRITVLGQIFEFTRSTSRLQQFEEQIILYMSDIVKLSYPTETKVNAMQSINTILTRSIDLNVKALSIMVAVVHLGLMDYTIDQRGDIGSLLRLESIEAAKQLIVQGRSEAQKRRTLQLLTKLAAEKLIKVRFQAWSCLQECLVTEMTGMRTFNHQADISSFDYFRTLLDLLQYPQFQEPLLIGLMSSLAGGTEEVSRTCSEALLSFVQDQDASARGRVVVSIVRSVGGHIVSTQTTDDREIIPAIDFLAFLVEHILVGFPEIDDETVGVQVWKSSQKVHIASSTLPRLEALIRLYSALTLLESYRMQALDKLTRLLLHRWPKIRGAAADAIFLRTATKSLMMCDYNASIPESKPKVLALRKELNVAGSMAMKVLPKSVTAL